MKHSSIIFDDTTAKPWLVCIGGLAIRKFLTHEDANRFLERLDTELNAT